MRGEVAAESNAPARFVHPGNAVLRRAVQENVVSFPSQVPVLSRQSRPDVQCRVVLLYFVQAWTMSDIGGRYDLPDFRVSQMLTEWAVRAFALGFIQVIDDDRFAELAGQQPPAITSFARDERFGRPASQAPAVLRRPVMDLPASAPPQPALLSPVTMPDLHVLNALELAIQTCGTRSGDFWLHTAAALRSFRAAIEAVERLDASGLEERITGELVVSPRTLVASAAAGAGGHPAQGVA